VLSSKASQTKRRNERCPPDVEPFVKRGTPLIDWPV
jgi:hypothetical protein